MGQLRSLLIRIGNLFRKRRRERELAEELESHLQMHIQDNVRSGMTPEEARRQAVIRLGGVEHVKEGCRDTWGVRIINELAQDLRYGLRQLRRNPGFTIVAVLTLALGIGGTTAIFSVLYDGLLNPLPYKDSDRLAVLVMHDPRVPRRVGRWAYGTTDEFREFQELNRVFDQVIGSLPARSLLLTGRDAPANWWGTPVTPNTFQVLGMAPLIGRTFTSEDSKPGAPPVVLLGYRAWQHEFGGDPGIVGQTLILNHKLTTVIGVMPRRFAWDGAGAGFSPPDCWLPWSFTDSQAAEQDDTSPVVGHLKPGVIIQQASQDLALLTSRIVPEYPEAHRKGITFSVESLTDACVDPQSRRTMSILMGGVGLLLLIACVNMANLLLARAGGREREFAIRASLGAGRLRLVRQLMIESLLLALGGAVVGSALAWDALGALVVLIPSWYIPSEASIRMNLPVLLFTAGVAVVSTLLFGLAPAVLAVKKDIQAPLKASGRTGCESCGHHRLRNLLVVSEVVLSLVLLMGAGLLFRSFWALRHLELGYRLDHVLDASLDLPDNRYKTTEQRNQCFLEVLRRVRTMPGVVSATAYKPYLNGALSIPIEVPGQSTTENRTTWMRLVGDRFFEILGIPLLAGRTISEEDLAGGRPVVVVNRAFVNKYFAGANPLGRQICAIAPPSWNPELKLGGYEIVGVVGDTARADHLQDPMVEPQIFVPFTAGGARWGSLLVRTAGDPASMTNAVRKKIANVDEELRVGIHPIQVEFRRWYAEPRFVTGILIGFAALGLALVSIGVYGVLSYSVSQRTQEIGVRMALGADAGDVRWLVLMAGLQWLLIGIGIGIPASITLEKVMRNRIWGITSADPLTLIVVSVVLTAVGLAACYFPARRAAKVDPMVALRYE
jgi:putative ABC transport system permease protein